MDRLTDILLSLPSFGGKKKKKTHGKLTAMKALCILLLIAFVGTALYYGFGRQEKTSLTTYSGTSNATAKYKVELSENSFFENETLEMDSDYIRSIVKNINIDFGYDIKTAGAGKTQIKWTAQGEMSTWYVDNGQEKELWSSSEVLSQSDWEWLSSTDQSITVPIPVNQSEYARKLEGFQNEMDLTVNGYYDVTFNVEARHNLDGEVKKDSVKAVVSIPLNGKVFKPAVTVDKKPTLTEFTEERITPAKPNIVLIVLLAAAALASAFALLVVCLCYEEKEYDEYLSQLRAKLASVEDRLVYVDGEYDWGDYDVAVSDFESLLHLADERALPILCTRNDEERRTVFFVTESQQDFYYVFDESQVETDEEETGPEDEEEL